MKNLYTLLYMQNGLYYMYVYSIYTHHCVYRQGMEKDDFQEKTIAARALWPSTRIIYLSLLTFKDGVVRKRETIKTGYADLQKIEKSIHLRNKNVDLKVKQSKARKVTTFDDSSVHFKMNVKKICTPVLCEFASLVNN